MLENASDLYLQKAGQWWPAWGREEWITKGREETLRMTDKLTILIVVMVSWLYTYVKIYQIIWFKCVHLYITYLQ